LSIVAGIMLSLGIWLFGRRGYFYVWLALGTIWLYALLTGMHPPVLRGAIMASLFLTAELLGRQRSATIALAFAAAVMVGISPRVLWDASFQMSFMAMTGLILFFPPLQSLFRKAAGAVFGEEGAVIPVANFVAESFSVSLGAIIAVWPLIAYYFNIISPVAPLATLFALPALPCIIIAGTLAGVTGLIALPVAQVIAWPGWLFASYMLLVVNLFSAVPLIEASAVKTTLVWVYYPFLALVIWFSRNRDMSASLVFKAGSIVSGLAVKWVIPPLLTAAILVTVAAAVMPDDRLHTSFLDVGQGDAVLIQRGGQQILIDGGPSSRAIALALGREMPFWDRTIDLVILTHPHADHITGLIEVLKRYKVKQVFFLELEYESAMYDEWLRIIDEKDIKSTPARAGQRIDFGSGAIIEVLNPQEPSLTGTVSDIDNNGLVLRLEMGKVSFLITGDIMWQGELELIARRADLTGTVLKIAHHGSATSTTAGFLALVNPRLAVISVAEGNSFGHPDDEVMDRLQKGLGKENIYRTDESGTIDFITDGERLWVSIKR
ncbi:DNA internalization-related competence protein ComEC/Rec2, partial [Chloroflexota bacterium]